MGAYILKDISFFANKDEKSQKDIVWVYTKGHEKNVYPHTEKSSFSFAGDLNSTLRHIGEICASIEDGLTQTESRFLADDYHENAIEFARRAVERLLVAEPRGAVPVGRSKCQSKKRSSLWRPTSNPGRMPLIVSSRVSTCSRSLSPS